MLFWCSGRKELFLVCLSRNDVDKHALCKFPGEVYHLTSLEFYDAAHESEQCVILTALHILAWVVLGATLTNDDVADFYLLTAEDLHAETFGDGIAAKDG